MKKICIGCSTITSIPKVCVVGVCFMLSLAKEDFFYIFHLFYPKATSKTIIKIKPIITPKTA